MSKNAFNVTLDKIKDLPAAIIKKYRLVYDGIDVDGGGTISTDELAIGMGLTDSSEAEELFKSAGLGDKDEITFDEFVLIFRKSDTDRVTRTLMKLFEETEQGAKLVEATRDKRDAIANRSPRQIPKIIQDLWDETNPNDRDFSKIDQIKSVLSEADKSGKIQFDSEDLVTFVLELANDSNDKQEISFTSFWDIVCDYLDEDEEFDKSSKASSSENGENDLTQQDSSLFFEVFQSLLETDGTLQTEEFRNLLMKIVGEDFLQAETRSFFFQILHSLDEDGFDEYSFEEFVTLMQNSIETTQDDTGNTEWDGVNSLDEIKFFAFQYK